MEMELSRVERERGAGIDKIDIAWYLGMYS
jgi:hypothetical protein